MVQKPKNRRSRPTRKPVTLDLKANEVKDEAKPEKPVHEAEPVAFDFGRKTAAETIEATAEKKADAKPAGQSATDAAARGAVESGDEPGKPKPEKPAASPKSTGPKTGPASTPSKEKSSSGGFAWLGGGVIGGLVALLLAGGLQWAGVVPSMRAAPETDLTPLQSQIDALSERVDGMSEASPAAGLEAVQSAADSNSQAVSALRGDLAALGERVESLSQSVSSGGAGEDAGLNALSGRLDELETQVAELSSSVEGLGEAGPSVDPAEIDAIRGEAEAARDAVAGLQSEFGALAERVTTVENEIDSGAGSRVAAAIAASALKSAADRGSGFMSELEAYASVSPDPDSVAALRDYAAAGVPTVAELVERFPAVANDIVAASRGVGEEAGIGERLIASARSLVQVRPVGEVEGEDPGAIAARMEVALSQNDLARAIAEWEKLPEAPKAASAGFAADMKARRELDTLINSVLTGAVDTAAPDAGQ